MSDNWIGLAIVGAGILAFATKPGVSDFQRETDALFAQGRQNAWSSGSVGSWLGLAVADNVRSGKYEDLLLISKYTVLIGGSPVMECYGLFGTVTCGKPDAH